MIGKSRNLARLPGEGATVFANAVCLCPEGKLSGWVDGHTGIENATYPRTHCELKRLHLVCKGLYVVGSSGDA